MKMTVKHDDIAESEFEDLNMSRTRFENINMSGAKFHDINFSDAKFDGAQIGGSAFRHIGVPSGGRDKQRPVTFEEGALTGSTFRKMDMTDVKLVGCTMEGMTIDGILVTDLLKAYKRK